MARPDNPITNSKWLLRYLRSKLNSQLSMFLESKNYSHKEFNQHIHPNEQELKDDLLHKVFFPAEKKEADLAPFFSFIAEFEGPEKAKELRRKVLVAWRGKLARDKNAKKSAKLSKSVPLELNKLLISLVDEFKKYGVKLGWDEEKKQLITVQLSESAKLADKPPQPRSQLVLIALKSLVIESFRLLDQHKENHPKMSQRPPNWLTKYEAGLAEEKKKLIPSAQNEYKDNSHSVDDSPIDIAIKKPTTTEVEPDPLANPTKQTEAHLNTTITEVEPDPLANPTKQAKAHLDSAYKEIRMINSMPSQPDTHQEPQPMAASDVPQIANTPELDKAIEILSTNFDELEEISRWLYNNNKKEVSFSPVEVINREKDPFNQGHKACAISVSILQKVKAKEQPVSVLLSDTLDAIKRLYMKNKELSELEQKRNESIWRY